MNDILMYNRYINLFSKLYNYIISNKNKAIDDIPGLKEYYQNHKKPFKKIKINDYDKCRFIHDSVRKELDEFIAEECINDNLLSFNSIWQFCQFVRYAEKVVFYKNTPDNKLYVDSNMVDVKERIFTVTEFDTLYKFKLERVVEPITKEECKVITLNVCRQYGKEMNNIFTIVNEDIKFNDQSDEYLINTINLILEDSMKHVLKDCVEQLLTVVLW